MILDAGDFRLKAPENLKACLAPYAGKKVDLGIRPSDFELCQGGENAIRAHVDSIEPLGDGYLIYVRVGERWLFSSMPGRKSPRSRSCC